jgi:CDP-glucose 4,6-dehydratase
MDVNLKESFKGKKVLVTGHTGFKGSWLTLWLNELGAKVIGVALDPDQENGAFNAMNISSLCNDIRQDINDYKAISEVFHKCNPQVVFHLAAQPLVLESYQRPIETFQTNIIGTANILEACRHTPSVKSIVVITTDKCYENQELNFSFKETDRLGGKDPYSASKASAELVAYSYRESFFKSNTGIGLATARAGNVIGGGDFSENRIMPDCIKALHAKQPIEVRNPLAVRPWQHVFDPLGGYLLLASLLMKDPVSYSEAWNFGPKEVGNKTVGDVVAEVIKSWGEGNWVAPQSINQSTKLSYEAQTLSLDITKALTFLNWKPLLSFNQSIINTIDWYKAQTNGLNMKEFGINQIHAYQALLK